MRRERLNCNRSTLFMSLFYLHYTSITEPFPTVGFCGAAEEPDVSERYSHCGCGAVVSDSVGSALTFIETVQCLGRTTRGGSWNPMHYGRWRLYINIHLISTGIKKKLQLWITRQLNLTHPVHIRQLRDSKTSIWILSRDINDINSRHILSTHY